MEQLELTLFQDLAQNVTTEPAGAGVFRHSVDLVAAPSPPPPAELAELPVGSRVRIPAPWHPRGYLVARVVEHVGRRVRITDGQTVDPAELELAPEEEGSA